MAPHSHYWPQNDLKVILFRLYFIVVHMHQNTAIVVQSLCGAVFVRAPNVNTLSIS